SLDSLLTISDASGVLAQNDNFGDSLDSQVTINVTAGQTYFATAAGSGPSTGCYSLTFQTLPPLADDFGHDAAGAQLITLSPSGSGRQSAVIVTSGEVDVFRFVAPLTGNLVIRQEAVFDSALDSSLVVTDSAYSTLVSIAGSDFSHVKFPKGPPP